MESQYPDPLSARTESSFAYATVKDRLPVILTKVIDLLCREKESIAHQYCKESGEDIKMVISILSKLKNEMQTDKPLTAIEDGRSDTSAWRECMNKEEALPTARLPLKWFSASWLFVENYFYRRIQQAFEQSQTLKQFDPFRQQKEDGMRSSATAAIVLAEFVTNAVSRAAQYNLNELQTVFHQLIQVNLWGNRCDLSISCGTDNSQTENPLSQIDRFRPNILVNDSSKVWDLFAQTSQRNSAAGIRLDVVFDNSGFELFTDLCLVDFLCAAGLVGKVRFYVKNMPWYVSDTMTKDFHWVLNYLTSQGESESLRVAARRWQDYVSTGRWQLEEDGFWTLSYDYSEMKERDPHLYNKLSEADLIIFKGDLNYRKLVGDLDWDPTTPFEEVLRGFHPAPLCSLRTIKADVVAGLNPGQAEATANISSNWMITGDFALVQFCGKR